MTRPLLVDLYCGAGAVSLGYHRAGFDVIGVDIEPQPAYPFDFIQADALGPAISEALALADAVHASPPCLKDTEMHASARREQRRHGGKVTEHLDLITPTRARLLGLGKPFVIENVMGAALQEPVILCGCMFNLGATTSDGSRFRLERKRKFETNWPLPQPRHRPHVGTVISILGGHVRNRAARAGGRGSRDFVGEDKPRLMREAMGIPEGQTMGEMSQAVPPDYAEWVGLHLLDVVRRPAEPIARPPPRQNARGSAPTPSANGRPDVAEAGRFGKRSGAK